ncbi:MAG: CRTAC1 family protein [Myxococcota bacterium]
MGLVVSGCGDTPQLGAASPWPDASTSASDEETTEGAVDPQRREPAADREGAGGESGVRPTELPPPIGPHFVEVTEAAGLDYDPGELLPPPFCLFDDINWPGPGDYCTPERYLGGAAVGDFDDDGWPDLYVVRKGGPGLLFHNDGDGSFSDETETRGLVHDSISGGAAWLDIEGDGDLDLMLTGFGTLRHFLYVNDGTGSFEEQAQPRGAAVETGLIHVGTSIGVGDYDLDGYLDMFVADWRAAQILGKELDHNRLLHNRGAEAPGYFEDVTSQMGIVMQGQSQWTASGPGAFGFAPAFVDLDGDHWPELSIAADYGSSRLFWNDGAGGFVDGTLASGVSNNAHGMGSTFGDYDADGDLDWFISAIWFPDGPEGNRLYRNDGARTFTESTDDVGVRDGGWGWGAAFFDADHDGDLDLGLASGWPSTNFDDDPLRLWLNQDEHPWREAAEPMGIDYRGYGRGLVPLDYDRDGDLDLLVLGNTEPAALYRNDGAKAPWLTVRATGQPHNPRGIGAEVRVQTQPGGSWQLRHIGVGSHLFGQQDAVAHFGLGNQTTEVHRVEVLWPATGRHAELHHVPIDSALVVSHDRP